MKGAADLYRLARRCAFRSHLVLPSTFDKREQCTAAITEHQKQPTPTGWSLQCIPSASPFTDNGSAE
ncbi:hypothetical protein [Mesorhizobium huakuii]|uniref:Uncharacterized protein n=1 Tax=Mesorhizobium huakuii TaxID=28104 RepID=A0A7G6T3A0_9HYPH|nr:hypothetical protein HB778_12670 [Mesorhizobium huakuii]